MNLAQSRFFAVGIIAVYIVLRFGLDSFWRQLSPYYSYFFEFTFVSITLAVYLKRGVFRRPHSRAFAILIASLIAGFGVHDAAAFFGIEIPFNFEGAEALFLLLILGPILEEFLFRFALWQPTELLVNNKAFVLLATTGVFCFGHFISYWYVPEEYKAFIIYQTAYVFLLGLSAGGVRIFYGLPTAVLLHMSFNFGFFFGARF